MVAYLARHYLELKAKYCKGTHGNYSSMSYEDIFHNSILFTINNRANVGDDIEEYFAKRLKAVESQVISDDRQTKKKNAEYANNLQA